MKSSFLLALKENRTKCGDSELKHIILSEYLTILKIQFIPKKLEHSCNMYTNLCDLYMGHIAHQKRFRLAI